MFANFCNKYIHWLEPRKLALIRKMWFPKVRWKIWKLDTIVRWKGLSLFLKKVAAYQPARKIIVQNTEINDDLSQRPEQAEV